MEIKEFIKENKTFLIVMTFYTVITFLRVFFHQPWFDEAHAWTIADELNLSQIFDYMQYEGHTFLWYLLLMPFAKTNFHYPYPMLLLNWIFCWTAVFIFWRKAPFNNVVKTLLTFSFPFFALYAIIARCYAIGIMFLFMLAALYKKQLERPYLFASLISLAANTSVMALSGVCGFGIIFTYNLIKSADKKKIIGAMTIMGIGAILVLLQLHGAKNDQLAGVTYELHGLNLDFLTQAFKFNPIVNFIILGISAVIFPITLWKNKDAFFFLVLNYALLISMFHFMYSGYAWHHFFLLVYLIIALWIAFYNYKGTPILKKLSIIILGLILACYVVENRYKPVFFQSGSKYVSEFITKDSTLVKSRLIFYEDFSLRYVPYLKPYNVEMYNYCSGSNQFYNTYKKEGPCKDTTEYMITVEDIQKVLSAEKDNYLLQTITPDTERLGISNGFIIESDNETLIFSPYKTFKDKLMIYKITSRKTRR